MSNSGGNFDKDKIEKTLIQAVKFGFFELPADIGNDGWFDGSDEFFEIVIDGQNFNIGGYERDTLDDVFYKVKGSLLKIIHEQCDMR